MGSLRKKVNELLDQKRLGLAIALALCISVAVSAVKFWDWFKYRIGLITAMLAMFSLNEWAVIIGILCTVITCMVNWYYERKKYLLQAGGEGGK
ncbi:HP1 family phage holin [Enterobacter asburiae]|uniref:HP1 family phage holin n=1 Tax=Enterobacter asburiae TaxID=61645 RepID=UPI00385786BA